jgi:hypothetical protein
MRSEVIYLKGSSLGSERGITALHFGDEHANRKIYIHTTSAQNWALEASKSIIYRRYQS